MKEEQNHHQEKLIKTSGLKNKLAQTLVCSADKFLYKKRVYGWIDHPCRLSIFRRLGKRYNDCTSGNLHLHRKS
mgnify:CR=1 FL=1